MATVMEPAARGSAAMAASGSPRAESRAIQKKRARAKQRPNCRQLPGAERAQGGDDRDEGNAGGAFGMVVEALELGHPAKEFGVAQIAQNVGVQLPAVGIQEGPGEAEQGRLRIPGGTSRRCDSAGTARAFRRGRTAGAAEIRAESCRGYLPTLRRAGRRRDDVRLREPKAGFLNREQGQQEPNPPEQVGSRQPVQARCGEHDGQQCTTEEEVRAGAPLKPDPKPHSGADPKNRKPDNAAQSREPVGRAEHDVGAPLPSHPGPALTGERVGIRTGDSLAGEDALSSSYMPTGVGVAEELDRAIQQHEAGEHRGHGCGEGQVRQQPAAEHTA